jgi:hypothetical protein
MLDRYSTFFGSVTRSASPRFGAKRWKRLAWDELFSTGFAELPNKSVNYRCKLNVR